MTLHTNSAIWLSILLACAIGCHTSAAKEGISMLGTVGTKAPDVSLHLHDGSTVKLSAFDVLMAECKREKVCWSL